MCAAFIGRMTQIWITVFCERHVDDNYILKMERVGSFETSVRSTRLYGITSQNTVSNVPSQYCENLKSRRSFGTLQESVWFLTAVPC
jgi:hypothetical protein